MHTPYTLPNQKLFLQKFEKYLDELHFTEKKKVEYRNYKDVYSTILYTDDALKYFFSEYAKLPAFNNTIFLITGDHRLPEIPMSTKIDRYHVPLIIYSPLLKKPTKIKSISSHLDITPSLLAFLNTGYDLKKPQLASWVGTGLDTAAGLRNIHSYPIKQTKNNLVNYISGMYFLDQDAAFTIHDNLHIEPLSDEAKLNSLKAELYSYNKKNKETFKTRKLLPDSIYRKYK